MKTTSTSVQRSNNRLSSNNGLIVRDDPRSPAAEAFRMIRTNMAFMSSDGGSGVWLFTSAIASEGKSTVVANLGLTLAAAGKKTLIIDADLRRPTQHRLLEAEQSPGLSHVLTGNESWAFCVKSISENLDLIPSGIVPPNPAELLQGTVMQQIIKETQQVYDTVLVDSSPVLMVTDAQLLARHSHRVILVVRSGFTRKDTLQEAYNTLLRAGSQVAIILNQVRPEVGYTYYTFYK